MGDADRRRGIVIKKWKPTGHTKILQGYVFLILANKSLALHQKREHCSSSAVCTGLYRGWGCRTLNSTVSDTLVAILTQNTKEVLLRTEVIEKQKLNKKLREYYSV